ncbi:MAG TPA: 23S rRNA (adenine(2503)-C(2))-methyltransferase RlmN [Bacteroidales bacterium]|nr:23S rRNA (adenine(2503)-C(2))-methyltransferase RlmN [Bacteroidales bacterium]HSA43707.1 23S rRNA (adenine(2503)-C(2))-methyltransferase RlmN [Bacteroidales bacterium]
MILLGKNLDELEALVRAEEMPSYTGMQLARWLYGSEAASFAEMSNLSKQSRTVLENKYQTGFSEHVKVSVSADGTRKYLFPTGGGRFIETAFMPEARRNTLCLSTQVGCKMGCLFCMTARQGFQANLSAGEIVNQLRSLPERNRVTNIVYMGMGEPFDNTEEVLKSLEILTAPWGFAISPKKITVSTIGLIPGMIQFLEKTRCNLAISLHSPFDEERRKLMPVQHVYPIRDVIRELIRTDAGRQRKISFEYILFRGINDSDGHIREMARLLNKLPCRVNLMRFHPVPNAPLEGADEASLVRFRDALNAKGIIATIRQSRGIDIEAACGLLSTKAMLSK